MTDEDLTARRVANLEASVRAMRAELEALRRELRAQRGEAPAVPGAAFETASTSASARQAEQQTPPARDPVVRGPERRRPTIETAELESLVGRYGTLALGALTILMAVGAFLGWAITNDLIRVTPGMRVGLGFVAAGVIAAFGWRMRTHASPKFGNTLLALALAVVHVDAWGAGPYLGLLPQAAALGIAALASAALAALALRTEEESLFSVGFGGALAAPFVTSTGRGDVVALLTYGLVVIGLGLWVLRGRQWGVAARLAGLAGALYALAGVAADRSSGGTVVHLAPTTFALLCAWLTMVVAGERHRAGLARAFLALAVLVLFASNQWDVPDGAWIGLALAGLATAYVSLRLPRRAGASSPVETVLLPLGFLFGALFKLDDAASMNGALLAAGWSAAALAMVRADAWPDRLERQERRGREHLATALLASALAIVLALHERDALCIVLLAAHGALSSVLVRRTRAPLLLLPALAVLGPASAWAYGELRARPAYGYTPFLGPASLAALALVLAWMTFSWHASRTEWRERPPELAGRRAAVRGLGLALAFFWVREELARAGSPDQATFMLIAYYALAGVVAISVGRMRSFAEVRRWGLALAIYAAAKAVLQASGLGSIGFKVGSYVVVGCFLLAVAYWYRASGDPQSPGAAAA